ncbi:MAG: prepilin-type N-terminal cleavage/methylation domain-containing protein [Bacilli bacterium]|nr:prepilin-type N-terminal cleavage/methylation domain-containing protein [Bacilli bacterium]
MNKKGFTLMELITVIAFLSIIGVILIPKINNAFKESRADQLESIRNDVIDATNVYLNTKCGKDYYNNLISDDTVKIYLNSISDCGLIESKIYNPMNEEYFDIDDEYVIVNRDEVGLISYEVSF